MKDIELTDEMSEDEEMGTGRVHVYATDMPEGPYVELDWDDELEEEEPEIQDNEVQGDGESVQQNEPRETES